MSQIPEMFGENVRNSFANLMRMIKAATPEQMKDLDRAIRLAEFPNKVRIFFSDANRELGEKICRYLGLERSEMVGFWKNKEVQVKIKETVKDCHCFVVGSYHNNGNIRHMEIKAIIRACKEAGAREIIAVLPFMGYMKQERIKDGREPIMAKLVAEEICLAGANMVLVIDLHSDAIQGFFNVPVGHLRSLKTIVESIENDPTFDSELSTGVSPDAGGVARVRKFTSYLGCRLAVISKHRHNPESAEITFFLGKVRGRHGFIVDDMIQSGVTLVESVIKLIQKGALKITIIIIHGDWCGDAVKNMRLMMLSGAVDEFIITDTTPLPDEIKKLPGVKVISVAPLLAEAIKKIYMGDALTPLYELNETESETHKKRKPKTVPLAQRLTMVLKDNRDVEVDLTKIAA